MANTLVQFRAEETSRIKAVNICEKLGIDLATYLRMCMSRLIQENGIPVSYTHLDVYKRQSGYSDARLCSVRLRRLHPFWCEHGSGG